MKLSHKPSDAKLFLQMQAARCGLRPRFQGLKGQLFFEGTPGQVAQFLRVCRQGNSWARQICHDDGGRNVALFDLLWTEDKDFGAIQTLSFYIRVLPLRSSSWARKIRQMFKAKWGQNAQLST